MDKICVIATVGGISTEIREFDVFGGEPVEDKFFKFVTGVITAYRHRVVVRVHRVWELVNWLDRQN